MNKIYLQLENGEGIRSKNIIGFFDLDDSSQSETTKKFLSDAQKEMRIVNTANDLPKSIVLTEEAYIKRVYISGLSTDSLIKRIEGLDPF